MAAPRLIMPSFAIPVEYEDPAGYRARNTTSSRRGNEKDAITGGTVDATTGATSRRCHVRDDNGDDETHLGRCFGHDTTLDTTRSDRRGSNERGGGRTEVERACMHTRARSS